MAHRRTSRAQLAGSLRPLHPVVSVPPRLSLLLLSLLSFSSVSTLPIHEEADLHRQMEEGNNAERREKNATSRVRVLRGAFGAFAGDDFPCDERDAHLGASWAKGTCMLRCGSAGRCMRAVRLCEKLAHCATVAINVEGTVATLKRESELSRRTSRRKEITFSQNQGMHAIGIDRQCSECDLQQYCAGGAHNPVCLLSCPKLNCYRGVELCYKLDDCVAVDVSFGFAGQGAVARLRFAKSTLG